MQRKITKSVFLQPRLKASSLVEVSVAAVLLSLTLGFSILLFEQLSQAGRGLLRLRQELKLVAYAEHVKSGKNYLNEEVTTDEGWRLVKKVSYYQSNPHLLLLELSLHNGGAEGDENAPKLVHREIIYEK